MSHACRAQRDATVAQALDWLQGMADKWNASREKARLDLRACERDTDDWARCRSVYETQVRTARRYDELLLMLSRAREELAVRRALEELAERALALGLKKKPGRDSVDFAALYAKHSAAASLPDVLAGIGEGSPFALQGFEAAFRTLCPYDALSSERCSRCKHDEPTLTGNEG